MSVSVSVSVCRCGWVGGNAIPIDWKHTLTFHRLEMEMHYYRLEIYTIYRPEILLFLQIGILYKLKCIKEMHIYL